MFAFNFIIMKIGIQALLWVLCVFFAYKIYDSINGPIAFNKIKTERYSKVISKLKDIGKAQAAHKNVLGYYSDNLDSLVSFVDTANYTLIQKRDSSYLEFDRVYRIDMLREVIVIDTLGYASVKDSLFGDSERYKNMMYIPVKGQEDKRFSLKTDILDNNGYRLPVFEVKVSKDVILHDQDKYLVALEKEVISVDGVNGPDITLGSLTQVSTSGNWPTTYDSAKQ
ncbi:MAG: hypothetical protein VXZ87_03655 [Bacteroidota bacterium]|nr:hypothetical protein [Bacteroidota bacterium]